MYKYFQVSTILKILEETYTSIVHQLDSITLSLIMSKTKKCQPDAGDRPDLIQTEPVPSIGLACQQNKNQQNEKIKNIKINHRSHVKTEDSLKMKGLIPLSLKCSSVSLPVANKLSVVSVKHPDDKWIKDVLTKTKKCLPAVRDTLVTGPHTPRVTVGFPDSGRARQQNKNKQNKKYKNHKLNYLSNVTLVDRVKHTKLFNQSQVTQAITALRSRSRSWLAGHSSHTPRVTVSVTDSSHGSHTLRVTVNVPDRGHNSKLTVLRSWSRSRPSGYCPHTPRVTVGVSDSGHNSKLAVLLSKSRSQLSGHCPHTPRVTVGIPDSGHNSKPTVLWSRSRLSGQSPHTPRVTVGDSGHNSKFSQSLVQSKTKKVSACHWGQAGSNQNRACP